MFVFHLSSFLIATVYFHICSNRLHPKNLLVGLPAETLTPRWVYHVSRSGLKLVLSIVERRSKILLRLKKMKKCFTTVTWFSAEWEPDKLVTCVMFCLNCFTKAAFLNSYSVGKVFGKHDWKLFSASLTSKAPCLVTSLPNLHNESNVVPFWINYR